MADGHLTLGFNEKRREFTSTYEGPENPDVLYIDFDDSTPKPQPRTRTVIAERPSCVCGAQSFDFDALRGVAVCTHCDAVNGGHVFDGLSDDRPT